MTDEDNEGAKVSNKDAQGNDLVELQATWSKRIEKEEADNRDYEDEAKRSLKWLRLDKESRKRRANGDKLNVAFANYEVMRSAIYSRPPQIVVQPRFGGGPQRQQLNDISEVVERATASENERSNLHSCLCGVRDELLKVGRGVGWVRYEADFVKQPQPVLDPLTGQPAIDPQTMQPAVQEVDVKKDERVAFDVVSWRNFLHGKASRWVDVPWVSRREQMQKDKFKRRFGIKSDAELLQIGVSFSEPDKDKDGAAVSGLTTTVYEIWDKDERRVLFMAKGAHQMLEVSEPLIDVEGFYPCPEPTLSVFVDGTLRPIPDNIMVEDQLAAIDALTKRIRALEQAVKVRGFYAKAATDTTAADQIEQAVRSEDDRQMVIPVPAFAAGGNVSLNIVWLPLDVVVTAITTLENQRKSQIDLVYQITGISDVMRGASQASETLGAQQIKDRWGSVRTRDKQEEMRRMARDLCRIASEVVSELFEGERIAQAAVYGFEPQMLEFLRNDRMRSFALDVETDSTVASDEQEDKKNRTEFTQVVGGLIQQALPVIGEMPEAADFFGSLLKFNVRGFRVGRELEKDVDSFIEAIKRKQQQAAQQPPQPDPRTAAVETKAKVEMRGQDIKAGLTEREQNLKFGLPIQPPAPPQPQPPQEMM